MWKRWNNYNGGRGPVIGNPTLIETTVEEGYLETIPEVDSLKSKRSSGSTTLPELPFRAMPPMQSISQQHVEPAWSQPSPTIPDYYAAPNVNLQDFQHDAVSPPSSPSGSNRNTHIEETPISPIEPQAPFTAWHPAPHHDFRSRIPQRVISDKNKQPELQEKNQSETRWDAYSGEPTRDESGLPSTVRPGIQPLEHQYPQLKERTRQILAGLREREAGNKPSWDTQLAPAPPIVVPDPLDRVVHKEPWKGASGRTTLVDPVQNTPAARSGPLRNPQHNIVRKKLQDVPERVESPTNTLRTVASEESIKPVAPLKILTKSRNPSPQSSSGSNSPPFYDAIHSAPPIYQHPKTLQSPFASPGLVRDMEIPAPLASARADSPPNDLAPDTPCTPTSPAHYHASPPGKVPQMPNEPDVSRFSWTTYSTSVNESPGNVARILRDESPPPPVPHMPPLYIKKRGISDDYANDHYLRRGANPSQASILTRKPVGSKPRSSSVTVASQLSLSKTLPQIPPEIEATDKIANLQAQLDALSMRKHNTTRIIRDLNASLKKNAIVYDAWKRRDVSDRIANQEAELQSIANEEHEVGIRLHRVQRKRDQEDSYEAPTGLWIRRVTS